MGAQNKVIKGDYNGMTIRESCNTLYIGYNNLISISKYKVKNYEVIDQSAKKSAVSAVGRGAVGAMLLGPVGLLAGLSAKSKGIYLIAIEFENGKRSLIEIDDKLYKTFMTNMF
ncbi:hypothetical protein [Clostridium beijerinckii]|uniref:hypothetical protein n=1 Tax=Clostridium beijerinckii TaxID=1520 RepID=UPI00098BEB99|nr:hypothetical protein [Clostridium beijerinckii]NRT79447.1 hypothetical protein [Clostridium beijerinckii]OOM41543.1 hypothetical protein CBEIJ_44730 [Clostridium beijerinckii]